MMEKLKKLLLYAGAEPEDFARCQMDVQIANRRRLTAFLGTACAFFCGADPWFLHGAAAV